MKKIACLIAITGLALTVQPAVGGDAAAQSSGGKIVTPPVEAPVECLTYDYLDLQYLFTDFDRSYIDDAHGVSVDFSKSLGHRLYLAAGADWSQTEIWSESQDLWGGNIGVGYYYPLSGSLHLTVEGGGTYDDREYGDEWGVYAGPGFRLCAYQGMELFGNALWHSRENSGDTWDFQVGAVFDLTESIGVKVSGVFNDDYNSFLAGLRIYY